MTQSDTRSNQSNYDVLRSWMPMAVLPVLVLAFFPTDQPRWVLMWGLAFAIYTACKWLTWSTTSVPEVPLWKHFGYGFAWPGLDAAAFLKPRRQSKSVRIPLAEWTSAFAKLSFGLFLFYVGPGLLPPDSPYLTGWFGMIGMVMILHFGLFHLLSCCWRTVGVNAPPLMVAPLNSVSISEFWGRRWNTAFRDLTNRHVFRPLIPKFGRQVSLFAAFLISGLVHELVISLPAHGGYGGPTLFFLLQALAIFASRSVVGRSIGLGKGIRGRIFTAVVLLASIVLLFHPPFVIEIVLPFMHAVGAV